METISKLPKMAKQLWTNTYNSAKKTYSEERARKIAFTNLKNNITKENDMWVAKFIVPQEFTTVRYLFTADSQSVSKDLDGTVYREYVLSSNKVDGHGQAFSDFALKRMVDQINSEKLVGRTDKSHSLWKELSEKGLSPEEIELELQKQETGIKAVAARYENGKVIASVRFAPEAYEIAKDFKGASIEARIPESAFRAGVFNQARLQGFVLTNEPANPDAVAL